MATVNTSLLSPLTALIPARYRRYVYALAALAIVLYGVWQASEGDWKTFVGALVAALVPELARQNTVDPESDVALEAASEEDGYGDNPFSG